MNRTDIGADPAFVASQSNPQAVSTKGFNPGDFPRWTDRARLHPLERQVFDLMCEVENAGADPLLTRAVCGLQEALHELVAWFDAGQPGNDYENGNRPLTIDDELLVEAAWESRKNATPFADEIAKARATQSTGETI